VVHNGIVENHVELRERLIASGRVFSSQTDTEVLAHLIDEALQAGAASLVEAVRAALRQVTGAYAIAVLSDRSPNVLVAAKNASPLVLGLGKGENVHRFGRARYSGTNPRHAVSRGRRHRGAGSFRRAHHRSRRKPVVRKPRTVTWTAGRLRRPVIRISC